MKKCILSIVACFIALTATAQRPNEGRQDKPQAAKRKYQILVQNESEANVVGDYNQNLLQMQNNMHGQNTKGLLSDLIMTGYKAAFVQKTGNASSNLFSLGVSYLTEALSSKRDKWMMTAKNQCHFEKKLATETKIEDFYALPSTVGPMDPQNLKFKGFGCKQYIELNDKPGHGQNVFYFYCKMKKDNEGLSRIVNHSKFIVEVDTFMFNPKYCNLPNDSSGSADARFDFKKRKNLNLKVKVKIFSSWMNELTQVFNDQLMGEFTVNAKIDEKMLTPDGSFVYDKNNPEHKNLVSVDGDCFVIPRSFTGTPDGSTALNAWGTGQYRIEMEVVEDCEINESYYLVPEVGNGPQVAYADGTPGNKKWDKNKWKVEWNDMKARKKNKSFWSNALSAITTAYIGNNWITTITDPLATALYSYETQELNNWLDLDTSAAAKAAAAGAAKPAGQQQGAPQANPAGQGAPQGAKP